MAWNQAGRRRTSDTMVAPLHVHRTERALGTSSEQPPRVDARLRAAGTRRTSSRRARTFPVAVANVCSVRWAGGGGRPDVRGVALPFELLVPRRREPPRGTRRRGSPAG